MKKVLLIFLLIHCAIGQTRMKTLVLTYDDAVHIALDKSYTIQSYEENKNAMQHYFNYYNAQFKPRLDLNVYAPLWNESVQQVQRTDGLPVYNSYGTMQFGQDLTFTIILPTGGGLALFSKMYYNKESTVLALQDYLTLKSRLAYTQFTLGFEQPIFTANTLKENLKEAKYEYEKATSSYTRGKMDIIYNVTEGFYALYRATRVVEINREKVENSKETFRIAKLKAESGRIAEGDVLIAEVALAQNQANLSESEGELERQKDEFKQLIGLDLYQEIQIITEMNYDTFYVNLEKAINEAVKNRLELQESKLDIKLQEIDLARANRERELSGKISAFYDLTGVSTISGGSIENLFQSSYENLSERPQNRGVTLSLSYPIFDWGRGSARVQQEQANLREAELSLNNLKTTIAREVRDIVRSVRESRNRLQIHEKNEQIANRSYEISKMRFENGDITSQELAVEQERLANTQLAYLDAFITYKLAVADLKRKTLWDFKNDRSYLTEIIEENL